ncbi:MAG: hypothetical protein ACM3QS_18580 [Bacteroidota bacterium]
MIMIVNPPNVPDTDWLPAHRANPLAELALIHGGIGMQPEQAANLAALARKGFAIRIPESREPSQKAQQAIARLTQDDAAGQKAEAFAEVLAERDGLKEPAALLYQKFGAPAPAEG